jgi:hypothetical protein
MSTYSPTPRPAWRATSLPMPTGPTRPSVVPLSARWAMPVSCSMVSSKGYTTARRADSPTLWGT